MVRCNTSSCPICGGRLRYYDKVGRTVRTKYRKTYSVKLRRLRCCGCGRLHRELTDELYPYKQYEAEMIDGVIEGLITSSTFGFEDYPCEMTMKRWITQKLQFVL